jgi:hypothetical protein
VEFVTLALVSFTALVIGVLVIKLYVNVIIWTWSLF